MAEKTSEKKKQYNITIALSENEYKKLNELMAYFDEHSIKKTKRSDVMRYLINRYHYLAAKGVLEDVYKAAERIVKSAERKGK